MTETTEPRLAITEGNYYSREAAWAYLTNSQRKTYVECPRRWMAELTGEWEQEEKIVFLHGKYLDCALTESPEMFDAFCQRHQADIYQKNGKKYKAFLDLDDALKVVKNEPVFMQYLRGEGQTILVFDDFHGVPLKMRLDNVNHDEIPHYHATPGFFSDLKAMRDVDGEEWVSRDGYNRKVHWMDAFDYYTQIALYQEGLRLKYDRIYPAFVPVMEKAEPFDRDVLWVSQDQGALHVRVEKAVDQFLEMQELKDSGASPIDLKACGKCKYCITNKTILRPTPITPSLLPF